MDERREKLLDILDVLCRFPMEAFGWRRMELVADDAGFDAEWIAWYSEGETSPIDIRPIESEMREQILNASSSQVDDYFKQATRALRQPSDRDKKKVADAKRRMKAPREEPYWR